MLRPFGFTLVVKLFALAQCQRHLRLPLLEVQLQRDESQPLALHCSYETADFLAVKQQLSCPRRIVVDVPAALVRRDMQVQQEDLAVPYYPIRVRDVRFSLAKRLDFGSGENDPGFPRVDDGVVMASLPVLRDRFNFGFWLAPLRHAVNIVPRFVDSNSDPDYT